MDCVIWIYSGLHNLEVHHAFKPNAFEFYNPKVNLILKKNFWIRYNSYANYECRKKLRDYIIQNIKEEYIIQNIKKILLE